MLGKIIWIFVDENKTSQRWENEKERWNWQLEIRNTVKLRKQLWWPDSSVGQSFWKEFGGRGLKSLSGQLSIATSNNPSLVNIICINSFRYTHVIVSIKFRLKQTWWLTKAIDKMISDSEQTMKLEWLYKLGSECELSIDSWKSVDQTCFCFWILFSIIIE